MAAPPSLTSRVRGEFLEMPGLRLTLAQACRLWDLDLVTCTEVLSDLMSQQFLHRTPDGAYVAFPMTRPVAAKASLVHGSRRVPRTA
jgi:hypothetical protein